MKSVVCLGVFLTTAPLSPLSATRWWLLQISFGFAVPRRVLQISRWLTMWSPKWPMRQDWPNSSFREISSCLEDWPNSSFSEISSCLDRQASGEGAPVPVPYRRKIGAVRSNNCNCYIPRDLRDDPGPEGEDQPTGNSQTIRRGPCLLRFASLLFCQRWRFQTWFEGGAPLVLSSLATWTACRSLIMQWRFGRWGRSMMLHSGLRNHVIY